MTDLKKWKALAEAVKEWSRCVSDSWESLHYGQWSVGHIDEDGRKNDVMIFDAGQYDRDFDNKALAEFYAASNPAAVLELLAVNEALAEALERSTELIDVTMDGFKAIGDDRKEMQARIEANRAALALQEKMNNGN